MMRIFISLILIFIVMHFNATSAFAQATKWPINKYKIVQQDPGEKRLSDNDAHMWQAGRESGVQQGLTKAQMRVLEQYFVDVGKEYQRLGFLEPKIDTLTGPGDAFEVFIYDYPDTETSARWGPSCGGNVFFGIKYNVPKRYIRLDLSRLYSGNSIAPATYDNIAHEIFHAIQYSYPLFAKDPDNGCKLGAWIVEGTAEAVGSDMARTLKGVKINNIRTGPRDYSIQLYEGRGTGKGRTNAYWTSSLWRYIGEYAGNGKKFPPVKQGKKPDYRYLQDFFATSIPRPNEKTELDWLDDNLSTKFKLNLASIYSNFISGFVHYVPDRVGTDQKAFLKLLFGGCKTVKLSDSITFAETLNLKFNRVSAQCIEVFYEGPKDKLDIGIYMETDKKTVNSIQHVGVQYHTASGENTIKVLKGLKGDWSEGEHYGDWVFQNVPFRHPKKVTKSNTFIISNIAKKASDTRANPIVSFTVSYAVSEGSVNVSK